MVFAIIDLDAYPEAAVISWREVADISTTVRQTNIRNRKRTREEEENDESSASDSGDSAVQQGRQTSSEHGTYHCIIAKWCSGVPNVEEVDENSSDNSYYSDEDLIDDTELVKRFETKTQLVTDSREYCTVALGDTVQDTDEFVHEVQEGAPGAVTAQVGLEASRAAIGDKISKVRSKPNPNRRQRKPKNGGKDRGKGEPCATKLPLLSCVFDEIPEIDSTSNYQMQQEEKQLQTG